MLSDIGLVSAQRGRYLSRLKQRKRADAVARWELQPFNRAPGWWRRRHGPKAVSQPQTGLQRAPWGSSKAEGLAVPSRRERWDGAPPVWPLWPPAPPPVAGACLAGRPEHP